MCITENITEYVLCGASVNRNLGGRIFLLVLRYYWPILRTIYLSYLRFVALNTILFRFFQFISIWPTNCAIKNDYHQHRVSAKERETFFIHSTSSVDCVQRTLNSAVIIYTSLDLVHMFANRRSGWEQKSCNIKSDRRNNKNVIV